MRLSRPIIVLLLVTVCVFIGQYLALTRTAEEIARDALTQATQLSNETVTRLFVELCSAIDYRQAPLLGHGLDSEAEVAGEDMKSSTGQSVSLSWALMS